MRIRNVPTDSEIRSQWDELAGLRRMQIRSQIDQTFWRVLVPAILNLLPEKAVRILDIGCGSGELTRKLAKHFSSETLGIDPSAVSISLADDEAMEGVTWRACSLGELAIENPAPFDLIVSNMVISNVSDASRFLADIAALLRPDGAAVVSLPHPTYWPAHLGLRGLDWFDPNQEVAIDYVFRLRADPHHSAPATYIHRPWSWYLSWIENAGLIIDRLLDAPTEDSTPRFRLMRLQRL